MPFCLFEFCTMKMSKKNSSQMKKYGKIYVMKRFFISYVKKGYQHKDIGIIGNTYRAVSQVSQHRHKNEVE